MSVELKRIGTFLAHDSSGTQNRIFAMGEIDTIKTGRGSHAAEGTTYLQLGDGRHVNYIGDGKYELLLPPTELTGDDPNAIS